MTSIHIVKTAHITMGNKDDISMGKFLDEIRIYIDHGWMLKKIWYEPQYGPTDNYFNATLEKVENE